jgi:hypothetical protein
MICLTINNPIRTLSWQLQDHNRVKITHYLSFRRVMIKNSEEISNCSCWHAYAKLVSKFLHNPYRISPPRFQYFRFCFLAAILLRFIHCTCKWRLTAEHPLQFGSTSRAVGGPGEGLFTVSFPSPANHNTTFVPFPHTNKSMQHIRSGGSKLFCPLPESAFTFLLELQIIQIKLLQL